MVLSMMDDPRHARIRRLVTSGLTPRTIRRLEEDLRRRDPGRCSTRIEPGEPFDFLVEVAAELPMQAICGLLGVPEEDRHELAEAVAFDLRHPGGRRPERHRPPSPRPRVPARLRRAA